jgi:hypothetical protein
MTGPSPSPSHLTTDGQSVSQSVSLGVQPLGLEVGVYVGGSPARASKKWEGMLPLSGPLGVSKEEARSRRGPKIHQCRGSKPLVLR